MTTNLFSKACSHVKRYTAIYISSLALLAMAPTNSAIAQTLSIQFTDSVALNEAFPIRFMIENAEVREFEAPHIQYLEVVSGPNTSKNFSSINGQTKQSTHYTYWFRATKTGKIKIPKIKITTDQGVLSCEETQLIVTEEGPKNKMQKSMPNDGFNFSFGNDMFNNDFFNQGFGNMPDMQSFFNNPNFSFQIPDFNSMMPNMEQMLRQFEQMVPQIKMFEFSPNDPNNPYLKQAPKEEDKPKIDSKTKQPIYKI